MTTTTIRLLPFDVRPFHRETLESYSRRLLKANACETAHRPQLSAPFQNGTGAEANLAAWKTALTTITKRPTLHLDPSPVIGMNCRPWNNGCIHFTHLLPERTACTLCSRGDLVEQNPHFENLVCRRHRRWLGVWGGPEQQRPVPQDFLEAHHTFDKLRRKRLLDLRLYLLLVKALGAALDATIGLEEVEPLVFPTAMRLAKLILTDDFARDIFNPANTFAHAQAALGLVIADALGESDSTVLQALWIYLRPTMLAIRSAIDQEEVFKPDWNHDYPLRDRVAESLVAFRGDLEPVENYLPLTDDTPVTAVMLMAELSQLTSDFAEPVVRHFVCDQGHEFDYLAPELLPAGMPAGRFIPTCGLCTDRRVRAGDNDLQTRFPTVAAQFDPYRNGGLTAADVTHSSRTHYTWTCESGHSHVTSPFKKTAGTYNCAVCSNRTVRHGANCLITTHPDIAAMWADEWGNRKSPFTISAGTNPLSYWRCHNGHRFFMRPWEITSGRRGCNQCVRERTIRPEDSLAATHPDLLERWHPELNDLTPDQVTHGERRTIWWICEKGHEFDARLDKMTLGQKCPICTSRRLVSGQNDLQTIEPILCREYDTWSNWKAARNIFPSDNLLWWRCHAKKHLLEQTVYNRRQSGGCPKCIPAERILNDTGEERQTHIPVVSTLPPNSKKSVEILIAT